MGEGGGRSTDSRDLVLGWNEWRVKVLMDLPLFVLLLCVVGR